MGPPQLTHAELNLIAKLHTATAAHEAVNVQRKKAKVEPIGYSSVAKFKAGVTHLRGKEETRGAKRKLSKADVKKLVKVRRKLIQEADGEERVTHKDFMKAVGLTAHSLSQRVQLWNRTLRADSKILLK